MTTIEITLVVMAIILIGFAFHLLYLTKEIKVLIVWSITLSVSETAVYFLDYKLKWYVLAALPFYLFSMVFILIKMKKRVDAAIKRIEEREEEEKLSSQQETPYGK